MFSLQCDWCSLLAEPDCLFQAHHGSAYDVKFYGDDENALLLRFKLLTTSYDELLVSLD